MQKMLLHCCCAPCSSYVMEYLYPKYNCELFFYNPNISTKMEYEKRLDELFRYNKAADFNAIIYDGGYKEGLFDNIVKGYE
ncbi:MAG: epoxyqueuosine reductase QueH, partial [Oscillospiraceae bacterium]|nr:epoxyqueuosine reductase QueH [Oscillospiraceae bacterium]